MPAGADFVCRCEILNKRGKDFLGFDGAALTIPRLGLRMLDGG